MNAPPALYRELDTFIARFDLDPSGRAFFFTTLNNLLGGAAGGMNFGEWVNTLLDAAGAYRGPVEIVDGEHRCTYRRDDCYAAVNLVKLIFSAAKANPAQKPSPAIGAGDGHS